jgi:hypothetical protein
MQMPRVDGSGGFISTISQIYGVRWRVPLSIAFDGFLAALSIAFDLLLYIITYS